MMTRRVEVCIYSDRGVMGLNYCIKANTRGMCNVTRNTYLVLALDSGQSSSYCRDDRSTPCSQEAPSYPTGVYGDTNEVALGDWGHCLQRNQIVTKELKSSALPSDLQEGMGTTS